LTGGIARARRVFTVIRQALSESQLLALVIYTAGTGDIGGIAYDAVTIGVWGK
jgi:hypothetical protein